MKNYFYELRDVNNTCIGTSNWKSELVTQKINLMGHYREYKVAHLSKFLKINKRKGVLV